MKEEIVAFKVYNRRFWKAGELIKMNHHTVWVRLPEILSPKGRLLRKSNIIKRHIIKDRVLMYDETIKELYIPLCGGKARKYVETPEEARAS